MHKLISAALLLAFVSVAGGANLVTREGVTYTTGSLEPGQADMIATSAAQMPTSVSMAWSYPDPERRGVYVASQELLGSREKLIEKLDAFTSANLNTVMVDTWFRGFVGYPGSRYVPQFPGAVAGGDYVAWIIPEIHKRGMRAEAWASYGMYAYYTRDAEQDKSMGPLLDKYPDLAAVDSNGRKYLRNKGLGDFYSLCPANPRSHDVLTSIIVEMVTKYPFDALHLDRMRFPAENYCYCEYCKTRFRSDTGLELADFPVKTPEAEKFLQWKRIQNLQSIAAVERGVHAVRPDMPILSYVVGPFEMDSRAQSWDLWVKQGFVSAVSVSMYGQEIESSARRALELLGGDSKKMICAINAAHPGAVYLRNIQTSRGYQPLGQDTWYSGDIIDDVPSLAVGPYARPARSPFAEPAQQPSGADADYRN